MYHCYVISVDTSIARKNLTCNFQTWILFFQVLHTSQTSFQFLLPWEILLELILPSQISLYLLLQEDLNFGLIAITDFTMFATTAFKFKFHFGCSFPFILHDTYILDFIAVAISLINFYFGCCFHRSWMILIQCRLHLSCYFHGTYHFSCFLHCTLHFSWYFHWGLHFIPYSWHIRQSKILSYLLFLSPISSHQLLSSQISLCLLQLLSNLNFILVAAFHSFYMILTS